MNNVTNREKIEEKKSLVLKSQQTLTAPRELYGLIKGKKKGPITMSTNKNTQLNKNRP